jgi:uncharacterized protein (TIGR03435 family)
MAAFVPFVLAAQPTFEVASVKAMTGPTGGIRQEVRPTLLTLSGVTLGYAIRWAYGMEPRHTFRTVGPGWIDPPTESWYEIAARTGSAASPDEMRSMLQRLLAERFKLVVRREKRELPVYELVVAAGGPKFRASETAGESRIQPEGTAMKLKCERVSMRRLAEMVGPPWTGRPVIDSTGLEGSFDFTLDLERYRETEGRVDMESTVMRALPQLGLRLRPARVALEVLVVEHAERTPAAN